MVSYLSFKQYVASIPAYLSAQIQQLLKKFRNIVSVNNLDTKTVLDVVLVSLLLTLNIFHTFF